MTAPVIESGKQLQSLDFGEMPAFELSDLVRMLSEVEGGEDGADADGVA